MPKCDFCGQPAAYDAKTILGPWAYVCQQHFNMYCHHTEGLYTKLQSGRIYTADDINNTTKEDYNNG